VQGFVEQLNLRDVTLMVQNGAARSACGSRLASRNGSVPS
jgi:hypothetical protein